MIVTIELQFPPNFRPSGPMSKSLRGAICSLDPSNPLLCQRSAEGGGFLYRYPHVHYRWHPREKIGLLVGFLDGAEYLLGLRLVGTTITLGEDEVQILGAEIKTMPLEFTQADTLLAYKFKSPWLPLSPDKYQLYKNGSPSERQETLNRLARNQLVNAMRDLGMPPDWRVFAAVQVNQTDFVKYKDTMMFGVWGSMSTNVNLPSGFALGRKVSYGFGWLER